MTVFKEFQSHWTPIINNYLEKHLASEVDDKKNRQDYGLFSNGWRQASASVAFPFNFVYFR